MKINLRFWIAVLFLFLEAFFFWLTLPYPEVPAFVPRRLLIFLFLVTLFIMYKEWKDKKVDIVYLNMTFMTSLVLSVGYVAVMSRIGYVISSVLYMLLLMVLLGNRKYFFSLVLSAAFSIILFLLFTKVLTVPLPHLIRGTLL